MKKRYLALVQGDWQLGSHECRAPLLVHSRQTGERHVTVHASGKEAVSRFSLVQSYRRASLVEVSLITGRTHQIRAHAAHLGHPVAGDLRYGDEGFNSEMRKLGLNRMFLHAHSIAFTRPFDGTDQHFSAPLDDTLRKVLDRLA